MKRPPETSSTVAAPAATIQGLRTNTDKIPEPHPACAGGEGAQQSKNLPPAPLGNPGRRKPLFLSELSALHHVQHGKRAVGLDPEREPVRGNHERLPPRERSDSRSPRARTASLRPRRPASGCRPANTVPKLSRREF